MSQETRPRLCRALALVLYTVRDERTADDGSVILTTYPRGIRRTAREYPQGYWKLRAFAAFLR